MKFNPSKGYRRISGKGVLVLLQKGHVFASENVYVGPEPKGSGSMTPCELLEAAKQLPKPEEKIIAKKKVGKKVRKKVEKKTGLYLGVKPPRKTVARVVGRR